MTLIPFGYRYSGGATGDNPAVLSLSNPFIPPGNPIDITGMWTVMFTPTLMNLPQGQFEVTKCAITGTAPNVAFSVYQDQNQLDGSTTDAAGQCMFYKASDQEFIIAGGTGAGTLYFYFNDYSSTYPPMVTIWLSYDPSLKVNLANVCGGHNPIYNPITG